jgi:hypothetical protein
MSAFLLIMVLNILKFTIQKEKKQIFIFKYCKIDVKSAVTLIFAATLITEPTVVFDNLANFLSISPNQTPVFAACLPGPSWTFLPFLFLLILYSLPYRVRTLN